MQGTVEFFNNKNGWGIILSGVERFFVHYSSITDRRFFPPNSPKKYRTLVNNQHVLFSVKPTSKRLNEAIDVSIYD